MVEVRQYDRAATVDYNVLGTDGSPALQDPLLNVPVAYPTQVPQIDQTCSEVSLSARILIQQSLNRENHVRQRAR